MPLTKDPLADVRKAMLKGATVATLASNAHVNPSVVLTWLKIGVPSIVVRWRLHCVPTQVAAYRRLIEAAEKFNAAL